MVMGACRRLERIKTRPEYLEKRWTITHALQKGFRDRGFDIGNTQSPVTPVKLFGDIPEATNLVVDLRENYNLFCSIVVYPVIPKGEMILRIIPTAVHTLDDVEYTLKCFDAIRGKLEAGEYRKEMPDMAD